jgi:hypothetical protein
MLSLADPLERAPQTVSRVHHMAANWGPPRASQPAQGRADRAALAAGAYTRSHFSST